MGSSFVQYLFHLFGIKRVEDIEPIFSVDLTAFSKLRGDIQHQLGVGFVVGVQAFYADFRISSDGYPIDFAKLE
jgi:hypothetical protein